MQKVIPGDYATTIVTGPSEPPMPTEAEYRAEHNKDKVLTEDVCKAFDLTLDELTQAKDMFRFPMHTGMRQTGWMVKRNTYVYSRGQIREWLARVRPLMEKFVDAEF
jgi:hypothetical protein